MRVWMVLAVALAASANAWAQAPGETAVTAPSPLKAHVITNPDWLHKPGPEDFSQYWPTGASSTGMATIQCDVTAKGKLAGCVVLAEAPQEQGFGAAALKIATHFQMRPKTLDGQPVGGGSFATTIHFTYAGIRTPQWVRRPTEAEIQEAWPPGARGTPGQAVLNCWINSKGGLTNCNVDKETPRGMGFGAAALKLAPVIRLTPKSQSNVLIPVDFLPPAPKQVGVANFGASRAAMTNAPWLTAPLAADLAGAWPANAPANLETGHARLRCGFQPDGALGPCTVLSEDPPRLGFGAAALALVRKFHLRGSPSEIGELADAKLVLPFVFTNPKLGGAAPGRITQFSWVTFIDPDIMTSLYPSKASDAGIKTGRGVVDCTVAPGGRLGACTVTGEDPPGLGFGPAALEAVQAFTLNPWTDAGQPVDGAKLLVPIRFVEAEPTEPAQAQPPPAPKGANGG